MICPSCGYNNSEDAEQCAQCNYKFRFGHAHGDPANMTFISSGESKKAKMARYVFAAFFIFIFIVMIISWFLSI